MMKISRDVVGSRIRLRYTNDMYTNLKPGDEGIVTFVDDTGTMFVDWDSGSRLGINPEFGDRYEFV